MSAWVARSHKHKHFAAFIETSGSSLLLGPHQWTVHNDSKSCSYQQSYTPTLTLTACNTSQFTCNSGYCIDMTLRAGLESL